MIQNFIFYIGWENFVKLLMKKYFYEFSLTPLIDKDGYLIL